MNRVIIRGVCSNSGFGVATQGLIKTSIKAGFQTNFIPINAHALQHRKGFTPEDLQWMDRLSIDPFGVDTSKDIVIDVGSLVYGKTIPSIPCKKNILYCTYETVKIHGEYASMMNRKYKQIWTATNFNKASFYSSGVSVPIKVLPHYVDFSKFSPDSKPMQIRNKKDFTFLYNADLSYRKGLHNLIPAFIEVFKDKEDVCLILKLMMSSPDKSEMARNVVENLNRLLYMRGLMDEKRPPILLIFDYLSYDKLSSLYTTADCYVAPFHGEGFCYPIAEAMACGLPIIATRCSGPTDYLDRKCGHFVHLDEKNPVVPITDDWQLKIDPLYKGQSLYNPSYKSLKEKLQKAYDDREELKEMGKHSREKILEYGSLDKLANTFKEIINEDT